MSISLRRSYRLWLVVIVIAVIAGTISARSWLAKPPVAALAKTMQQDKPPDVIKGALVQELVTLRHTGFDPKELTIPTGQFLLSVDNLTGLSEVNLTLDEEKKNRLKTTKIESRFREWREVIDLKPGVYVLSVTTHPQWVCRITVTDKERGK